MLNFLKDHSPTRVVFLLCPFVLGLFLRFYDIGSQSPWTDELASWFYLRHLDLVFSQESHSPFYYALLRLFLGSSADISGIRIFSATVSCLHLVAFFYFGQKCLKEKFLIFWILICLYPLEIIFARMGRHYSWLLSGTVLFYFLLRLRVSKVFLLTQIILLSFVHIFSLFPMAGMLILESAQTRNIRRQVLLALGFIPVIGYYLFRALTLGSQKVASNVSWNTADFKSFWDQFVMQFFGQSYPRDQFFDLPFYPFLSVFLVSIVYLLWKRPKAFQVLLLSASLSFLAVFILNSSWMNLWLNRYFIFLCGLWILAIAEASGEFKAWKGMLALGAMLGLLTFQNPLWIFPWERESIEDWRGFSAKHPEIEKIICSNRYQGDYYDLPYKGPCQNTVMRMDRPMLFLDLNHNDKFLILQLMNQMTVSDYIKNRSAIMLRFDPKP